MRTENLLSKLMIEATSVYDSKSNAVR